jgi:hypothetical protein
MEDWNYMKKLLMFSVALAAFSGLANAQPACGSLTYTLAALGTTGCEVGDKIFSNFSGTLGTNEVISFSGGVGNPFTGPAGFTLEVSDLSNNGLTGNFNISYQVRVDPTVVLIGGGTNQLTRAGSGIVDSGAQQGSPSTATLSNTLSLIAGTSVCASPGPQSTDAAGTVTPTVNCPGLNATNIGVNMVFNYTVNGGDLTQAQDTFGESNTQPTGGTPEPVSMLLFGSGLFAVSLIGRKKLVRK